MTQKERALLVIRSILISMPDAPKSQEYLVEKIDACLELARPEVLLSERERKEFEKKVEDLRSKGKII